MPLKKGSSKAVLLRREVASDITCYFDSVLSVGAFCPVLAGVAIGTERYQIAIRKIRSVLITMMNDERANIRFPATLTGQSANAPYCACESESHIAFLRLQGAVDNVGTSTGTESSFTSLEFSSPGDNLPTQLTGRPLNTGKRTIFLASTQYVGAKLLSAGRTCLFNIVIGVTAALRAVHLPFANSSVVPFEGCPTNFATIHATTV